ncbi:unnamed protein product, partial [marine sediment metagenome]
EAFKQFVKNSSKIELDEKGKTKKTKKTEVSEEVKDQLDKFGLSEKDYEKYGGEKTPAQIQQMLEKNGAQIIKKS